MEKKLSFKKVALIYAIPLAIFSITFYLLLGGFLTQNPQLTLFLTLDLMLTAPFLYYLAIRKTNIPKFTVVSIFVIGTLLVSHALPHDFYPALAYVEMVFLPLLEFGIISFLIYFMYKKRKEILAEKDSDDYLELINKSAEASLGKNIYARLFATEIAFVTYGLFLWKKRIPKENEFTYHMKNGLAATLGCIGGILVIEAFAMHIVLEYWSVIAAWFLTFGSIYAIFQITAHIKACSRRLIAIEKNNLVLRYGLFGDVKIDYDMIKSVEISRKTPKDMEGVVKLALVDGLESHNMILYLKEEVTIQGAYGIKKTGNTILLHIDEKERFNEELNLKIS